MGRNLSAQAVQQVIDLIAAGKLEAGQALAPEAVLAEELGVSRLTMREAVRVLKDRGVVRVIHGRGTYVCPMDEWTDLETIIHVLGQTTSRRELGRQLIEIRRMIEVGASGLAAASRTDDDIRAMRRRLEEFDSAESAADIEGVLMADIAFHQAIAAASGNPFLLTIMRALEEPLMRSRRETTAVAEVRSRARHHHHRIFEAIEDGDADRAKDAMRAHMTQTREDLERLQRNEA